MSEGDFRSLEKTIDLEDALFPKAIEMASREWNSKDNQKVVFPAARLTARSILSSEACPSLEKAQAKRVANEEQGSRNLQRKKDEMEARNWLMRRAYRRQEAEDIAKARVLEQAAKLVKAKMDILMNKVRPR
jgi:hypothetical protein